MLSQSVKEIFTKVKDEISAATEYLDTWEEVFTEENREIIDTSLKFFALTETALIESAFSRLSRLMDPATQGRNNSNNNLSLERLANEIENDPNLEQYSTKIKELHKKWKDGEYASLKRFRNKLFSHSDFETFIATERLFTTQLDEENLNLLFQLKDDLLKLKKDLGDAISPHPILDTPPFKRPFDFISLAKTGKKVIEAAQDKPELSKYFVRS